MATKMVMTTKESRLFAARTPTIQKTIETKDDKGKVTKVETVWLSTFDADRIAEAVAYAARVEDGVELHATDAAGNETVVYTAEFRAS